jgi:TPR repeat protein
MPKEIPMKHWLNILALTTMLVLHSSANAFWDTMQDAKNAYMTKDYCKAYEIYMKFAEKDDPVAQRLVGFMNEEGKCVSKDSEKAAEWYRKSADNGDKTSQNNLANLYFEGKGVKKDKKEAEKFFRSAANQGDSKAQFNLGLMLFDGDGVDVNKSEGVKWFTKSAEQGLPNAQYSLGSAYMEGEGVEKNEKEGTKWLMKAADQGDAMAQFSLGAAYYFGQGVDQNYQDAIDWWKKAADHGHPRAQYRLGLAYDQGKGLKKDEKEALLWYRKAAEQGDADAQYLLGMALLEEESGKNLKEGVKWLSQSAEQGESDAQYELGKAYYFGNGVTQDYDNALLWIRKSADQNNAYALGRLGIFCIGGRLVDQNFSEAVKYLKLAINNLDATSEYDQDQAKKMNAFLRLAAKRGILDTPLSLRSKDSTVILDPGTYIIYLEDEKRLLHPREGTFTIAPAFIEGDSLEIAIDKSEGDGQQEEKWGKKSDATLKLSIETNFLIREIFLDGARLDLSSVLTGAKPDLIKTKTDVSLSSQRIQNGLLLKIHSREGKEHLRQIELRDGKLIVNTPNDTML